jgi:SAM-dependent methyltransferase
VTSAGAEFWDQFFRQRLESGNDLDWKGVWTEPFLIPLREAGVRTILELGCGTGHDAARLADAGYSGVPRTRRRIDVGDLSDAVLCR